MQAIDNEKHVLRVQTLQPFGGVGSRSFSLDTQAAAKGADWGCQDPTDSNISRVGNREGVGNQSFRSLTRPHPLIC